MWARAGGVTYRNLGVEDSGDPLPDWFFTQGVELVVDHCVTTAAGYSSSVSQGYTASLSRYDAVTRTRVRLPQLPKNCPEQGFCRKTADSPNIADVTRGP